jgi:hypothetical protein
MDKSEVDAALKWLSWINSGKTVAAFLVAIGVAGEFLGDFIAKPFNNTVENARKEDIAKLKKETSDANERTEKLRADNLHLERLILPREITDSNALLKYTVRFPHISLFTQSDPNDREADKLAFSFNRIRRCTKVDSFQTGIPNILEDVHIWTWPVPKTDLSTAITAGTAPYDEDLPQPTTPEGKASIAATALQTLLESEYEIDAINEEIYVSPTGQTEGVKFQFGFELPKDGLLIVVGKRTLSRARMETTFRSNAEHSKEPLSPEDLRWFEEHQKRSKRP